MPSDSRPFAAWLVCAWGAASSATATAAEFGVASASVQQAAAGDGANLMLGWIGRYDAKVVTVAIDHTAVEDSNWTLFRVGGTSFRSSRLSLSGSVDLGLATIDGVGSTYKKASFEAAFAVSDRWTLKALDTFVDVTPQSGHALGAAAIWYGGRALLLQAQATASVSGNLDDHSILLRADYRARPPYLLGGVIVGESNDRLLLNIPSLARNKDLREAFAGVVLPLKRVELTLVADVAEIDDFRRRALTIGLKKQIEGAP